MTDDNTFVTQKDCKQINRHNISVMCDRSVVLLNKLSSIHHLSIWLNITETSQKLQKPAAGSNVTNVREGYISDYGSLSGETTSSEILCYHLQ